MKKDMPLVVSGLALVIAVLTLVAVVFSRPLGNGMAGYEFGTPLEAYRSVLEMHLNGDLLAKQQYNAAIHDRKIMERLDTLEVKQTREAKGATILFLEYNENGLPKRTTVAMEKDARSGFWREVYVGAYGLRETDPAVAAEIEVWEKE